MALFVCEIGSHLPVRLSHGLMHAPAGLSLNVSELYRCLVDNRRDFGNLFRRQVQLSAEPFLHTRTDLFGMMKSKKKMPGIQSSKERATDSPGDEHEDESRNQFPFQCLVHCENSS
ncbi:MAG: hypothetical protein DME84_02880 [Verrucomicrobia bacterium]|nr:MAG: hypothetical protein DME84_02880 [Verrucomicrobiota bacterium]